MKLKTLLDKLNKHADYDLLDDNIRLIGQTADIGDVNTASKLIPFLGSKYPRIVHNAVAAAIADMQIDEYAAILMTYVKDAENKDYRGSFLYALSNLQCGEYFIDFIEIIIDGNFECRRMAWYSFEKYTESIDEEVRRQAISILTAAKILLDVNNQGSEEDSDRMHFIEESLFLLDGITK